MPNKAHPAQETILNSLTSKSKKPKLKIATILVQNDTATGGEFEGYSITDRPGSLYTVVDEIKFHYKPNSKNNRVPYLRVYKDDKLLCEFCQHNLLGTYYTEENP